jgi:hypothetical protein
MGKGYTYCPCCGIDSMDDELCAYCEEASCCKDWHDEWTECNLDNWGPTRLIISTPHEELDEYVEC